jgi:hypothetical protein
MGPKPTLTVKITNPPDEDYYVGLLEEREFYDWGFANRGFTEDEADIVDYFLTYDKDGYVLFQSPVGGNIKRSVDDNTYTFTYMVPDTFKVLVYTASGDEYVSDVITRHAFHSEFYYDVSTGAIRENRITKVSFQKFVVSTVLCIGITLGLEALILLGFSLARKKNWKYFFFINLITQTVLNVLLTLSGFISMFFIIVTWLVSEILIITVESVYYSKRLINKNDECRPARNVAYGITANIVSLLAELPVLFIINLIFGI